MKSEKEKGKPFGSEWRYPRKTEVERASSVLISKYDVRLQENG